MRKKEKVRRLDKERNGLVWLRLYPELRLFSWPSFSGFIHPVVGPWRGRKGRERGIKLKEVERERVAGPDGTYRERERVKGDVCLEREARGKRLRKRERGERPREKELRQVWDRRGWMRHGSLSLSLSLSLSICVSLSRLLIAQFACSLNLGSSTGSERVWEWGHNGPSEDADVLLPLSSLSLSLARVCDGQRVVTAITADKATVTAFMLLSLVVAVVIRLLLLSN